MTMAFLLASRTARASFLRLPPHIRTSAYLQLQTQTSKRCLSATTPRRMSLTDVALSGPTLLLNTLHSTGLPWCAVLPLAAFFVRGVFLFYFSLVPSRRSAQIQANLLPVSSALVQLRALTRDQDRLRKVKNPLARNLLRNWRVAWARFSISNEMGGYFGARLTGNFVRSGVSLGVLLGMTEAVRKMCGRKEGLLSMVLSPAGMVWGGVGKVFGSGAAAAEAGKMGTAHDFAEQAGSAPSAPFVNDGTQLLSDAAGPSPWENFVNTLQAWAIPSFDPSLKTEGFEWCVDLTAPDPTFILPAVVSALFMSSILFGKKVGGKTRKTEPLGKGIRDLVALRQAQRPAPSAAIQQPTTASPNRLQEAIKDPLDPLSRLPAEAQAVLAKPPPKQVDFPILSTLSNWDRILLSCGILMFFALINLPAGAVLYLASSQILVRLQDRVVARKLPIRQPIRPCERGVRVRARREWD
jgi:mitochondrial inner membrane protein COX18